MANIPWILAGLLCGGILHILTVFAVPYLAEDDAWKRLQAVAPLNTLTILEDRKAQALPFSPPDVIEAYCPFDLGQNNLVITAPIQEASWSVTISDRSGVNFFVMTGADAKRSDVRIVLIPRNRLAQEESTEKSAQGEDQNIIVSPTSTGLIAIHAPLRGVAFRNRTLENIRKAACKVEKAPDPLIASASEAKDDEKDEAIPASEPPRERGRRRRRR